MDELERRGLSLVVPVYNEEGSLRTLHGEIARTCEASGRPFELLFVDDGSSDGSAAVLDELADSDPRIIVIRLRRNFGKSAALAAGFQRVRGRTVLTLDADLQDDPKMIPEMLARIDAGADLVSGWKKKRHDPLGKRLPSLFFNAVIRQLTGIPLHDFNSGFKAYDIECIRELNVYGRQHRFLPVLARERGFKIEELVVEHRPRAHGKSKFGLERFFEGFLDVFTVLLLTRYRTRPLHFFVIPGLTLAAIGLSALIYLTVLWFMKEPIGTRPLLILGVLCTIGAIQFFAIGLVAELLVRTTISPREIFSIREIKGASAQPSQPQQTPSPPADGQPPRSSPAVSRAPA